MRNKVTNFPYENKNKFDDEGPFAKSEYASKRADGTINTHPQERMRASTNRDDNDNPEF
ncbi:small, acid-soluble spore protein K [Bacillus sp. FJAT-29790]|uniref:small, acid-soluble spore protein K n=1 Tax=Bacillus sp. FJAT-29790 TaxID=1895002 RepID=UPI001C219C39|nr:small, acid-soluble spore protein K [Bacillus sp. FJAT-29790]MBU8880595.1 small, acid-soluble spore protein K [Bacillus sp. FJAT-29790]